MPGQISPILKATKTNPPSGLSMSSTHQPDSRESTTITLRFDPRMLARIKRLARSRYLNYQSMMKQWLAERIEEEQNNLPNG